MRIIFFDGICNLCNDMVKFVVQRDKKNLFYFSSFGSEYAKSIATMQTVDMEKMNSIILLKTDTLYYKSTAVLKILKQLGGFWSFLYCFMIWPEFLRDQIYDIISRNRYLWFGKNSECWLPTKKLSEKFFN